MITSIFQAALECLLADDIQQKINLLQFYKSNWDAGKLNNIKTDNIIKIINAGRPEKPELVWPRNLPRRRLHGKDGRGTLLHAIAHIEFNAINLALDAVYRFQDMPHQYYSDWMRIACEEANHFSLLNNYLKELGYSYGDFNAHNGLWALAVETDYDVLVRMALVPRIMEARGLDVTPGIIQKFMSIPDLKAVEILSIILEEEHDHVAIGNKWFHYLCEQRGLAPLETFKQLIGQHINGQIKPPFATEARLKSGFTIQELEMLENL